MNAFRLWLKNRKMRKAAEMCAYWKARKEARLQVCSLTGMSQNDEREYVNAAAEEAKYSERIESLNRQ